MKDEAKDSLRKLQCSLLAEVGEVRVAVCEDPSVAFALLDDKKQGRFIRIMESWCEGMKLLPKMFNYNEGRSTQHNLLMQAFKGFKHRFYGFATTIDQRRTFVIVDADLDKKQDRADPVVLKRACTRADTVQSAIDKLLERKK